MSESTLHIPALGLDLTLDTRPDPETTRWSGSKSLHTAPPVYVTVTRTWDEGGTFGGVAFAPKYVYFVTLRCRSASVESEWHAELTDAWEQACDEASRETPRLYAEMRTIVYAETRSKQRDVAAYAFGDAL